ncbi:MAG: hypothetical protein JSR60_10115 [Proteobacteria bacterium]|nr:hypothetical protein [Pseudomonadota bacterium]
MDIVQSAMFQRRSVSVTQRHCDVESGAQLLKFNVIAAVANRSQTS